MVVVVCVCVGGGGIKYKLQCSQMRALTLLHSERPKLYAILAFLSAVGLMAQWFVLCICTE